MGVEAGAKAGQASQPLFVRQPSMAEAKGVAKLMGVGMTVHLDGVCALTVLSLLQQHQRDAGGINPRATEFAWALRDMIVLATPELQQLIDGGWAGIPLKRRNS